jgi:hypothetical protein
MVMTGAVWIALTGCGGQEATPAPTPPAEPAPTPVPEDVPEEGPHGLEAEIGPFVGDWPKLTMQGEEFVVFQPCSGGIPGLEILGGTDGGFMLRDKGSHDVFDMPISQAKRTGNNLRITVRGPDGPKRLEVKLAESGQLAEVKWLPDGDATTVATPAGKASYRTVVEPASACPPD